MNRRPNNRKQNKVKIGGSFINPKEQIDLVIKKQEDEENCT